MDWLEIFILVRGFERLAILFLGGFSAWMGWRLFFRLGDEATHQGEISLKSFTIKLQKVAPGIFFCALGLGLVGVTLLNQPTATEISKQRLSKTLDKHDNFDDADVYRKVSMVEDGSKNNIARNIVLLNTVLSFANTDTPISDYQRNILKESIKDLSHMRDYFLIMYFNRNRIRQWRENRDALLNDPDIIPKSIRNDVAEVESLASKLNYSGLDK